MTGRSNPKPSPRPPLTRERVLRAAITVADEVGLDSLTMRRVGQHLSVEAMSLYKHVTNKDELLDEIIDLVIGDIVLPSAEADWKTAMRQRAISAREVLVGHPWAVGMMESRTSMGPAALRYADSVIGSLRAGGFPLRMAGKAFWLLDSYIYGFVVQETSVQFAPSEDSAGPAEALTQSLPADQYRNLAELAAGYVANPDHDFAAEFEFGLDLILDGLDKHRTEPPS
jgi:AcrR family transcriptional regulator